MKKLITLILGIAFIYSCSTNETNNQTGANSSSVNVKWEIISSSNLRTSSGGKQITITYTNSAGQQQIETTNYPNDFTTWNKTFFLTNTNRPLQMRLGMSQSPNALYFYIRNGGTVKINLYLDGILTKSVTQTSTTTNQRFDGATWYAVSVFDLAYTIQ